MRAGRFEQRVLTVHVHILGFALFTTLLGSFLYCFERPQKIACSWRFLIPVTALCREGSITFRMLAICKDKHKNIEKRKSALPVFQ